MNHTAHVGLDIGGTASRWVLCDDNGTELKRGVAPAATGHIFNSVERDKLGVVFSAIAATAKQEGFSIAGLTAGITGYGNEAFSGIARMLTEVGLGAAKLTLFDDITLSYLANFAPGEGHLVSAGTGSIAIHLTREGDLVRVGGRGILIDDAGSGSWIALRALDRMYRSLDTEGSLRSVERLAYHLMTHVGGGTWSDVRQFVYGGDRGRIGTLSVAVAKAADDGDETAAAILKAAGVELALLARALIQRCGERRIGLVGGAISLHPVILDEVRRQLTSVEVEVLSADGPLAAARLGASTPHPWREPLRRLGQASK